jgi:tetratricopeptide (TPR) repeat protein
MTRLSLFLVPLCWLAATALAAAGPERATPPAWQAWEMGQRALQEERIGEAIGHFQSSLRLDPALMQGHLSLGAAYLAKGQDGKAVHHLTRYVASRPQHLIVRAHLAEVLLRLGEVREARYHFERFAADAQDGPPQAQEQLVHCHTRLLEIAERQGDEYAAHLQRGIGLYRLALKRAAVPGARPLSVEGLLFQAAAELVLARRARPDEARPCWYLHRTWAQLGQRQPAARWLRAAEAQAPFSALTPAERRDLALATQQMLAEARRK